LTSPHEIVINNRQRRRPIERAQIKKLIEWACGELKIKRAEIGVHFVTAKEMSKVHERYMNIRGSTDVITFDHGSEPPADIHGEIFISVADAEAQAAEFKTTWENEMSRYVIHGILHLLGYDDTTPRARAVMKRHENRLAKCSERKFVLGPPRKDPLND